MSSNKKSKKTKGLLYRTIIFILFLLIVPPLIMLAFIKAPNFELKLRTVFLLQRMNKIISLITILVIFLGYKKLKQVKLPNLINKKSIIALLLSIIFFIASFATQGDIDKIMNEGVSVGRNNIINFDGNRLLSLKVFSDKNIRENIFLEIENNQDYIEKIIYLEEIPQKSRIVWHGKIQEENKFLRNKECNIFLEVNNNFFNITENFLSLEEDEADWMSLNIDKQYLNKEENKLTLRKKCDKIIFLSTEEVYTQRKTYLFKNNQIKEEKYNNAILYLETKNNLFFRVLFKLGFIFRLCGVISLFIALFGINFSKEIFRKAKKEIFFSSIFAYIMYLFSTWLEKQWIYLSKVITYSVYFLLKISFLNPIINMDNPINPRVGISNLVVRIADKCSGVEGIGYFLIAYSVMIIINWRKINFKKALLMYVPGIISMYLLNILRVYLVIIVGAFINKEFALNSFHTNIGIILFIIHFMIFWPIVSSKIINSKKK